VFVVLELPGGSLGVKPGQRFEHSFGTPLATLGLLIAAAAMTFSLGASFGLFMERLQLPVLLLAAPSVAAVGLVLFAVAVAWPILVIGAVLLGAGTGTIHAPTLT
jgi:hypothetical protein